MGISHLFRLLCGISLFLFGMNLMGDGLKKVAGEKLEVILYKLSSTPLKGILLGFTVLMFGISAMTDAVYPLRESETFIRLLTGFSNPFFGVLIGLVFTGVIQSASAAVGILQTLAVTGAVSFRLALPVTMGIAIGASVPVLLSALGAKAGGKRTALIYLLVDALGALFRRDLLFAPCRALHVRAGSREHPNGADALRELQ